MLVVLALRFRSSKSQMNRLNIVLAATVLVSGSSPSYAFGSPAEAGAVAWCGARSRGASVDEANRQLRKTMASEIMMSTSFASGLVGLLNNRQGLQSQIDYHISKMCPDQLNEGINSGVNANTNANPDYRSCSWNPWLKECGGQDPGKIGGLTEGGQDKTTPTKYTMPGVVGIGFGCLSGGKRTQGRCDEVIIEGVAPGSPADLDGRLRKGDRVIEVNGQRVSGKTAAEITSLIGGQPGTYVTIVIEVNGVLKPISLARAVANKTKMP